MIPFPSINQYRQVVQHVQRKATFTGLDADGKPQFNPLARSPVIGFRGTVKLHGTNAAVVFKDSHIGYQSRNRILTKESDNMGFVAHMSQHESVLEDLRQCIGAAPHDTVVVFGEWCGEGIQNNVAISQLPRMFVIFAIKVNDQWRNLMPAFTSIQARVFMIESFRTEYVAVDFNQPELYQNIFVQFTNEVEAHCPVGKAFGVPGIGEGMVWKPTLEKDPDLWFKVKGEKHSASKVKVLSQVDIEVLTRTSDFVEYAVTENRLEQGLQHLVREQQKPFAMTSIGDFLRWVYQDVIKEEMDTIEANELDPKKLGGPIAQVAKRWYITKLNESVGVV